MRRAVWLLSAVAVAMASSGGCALFYGYDGYSQQGNGGGATSGTTSSSAQAGHGGGVGGSGGIGGSGGQAGAPPACPGDTTPDAFKLTWANVYGNGQDVTIAGVRADASGNASLAATFTGKIDVGSIKKIDGGGKKALLVARFDATGTPKIAEGFSGAGDVVATALALAPNGDPYAFATFTGDTQIGSAPAYVAPPNASTFSLEVGVDKATGDVQETREITCQVYAGGQPYCQVTIAAAELAASGLYLAGSFVGKVFLDDTPHDPQHALHTTDTDGFASIFGSHQYQLEGAMGPQAMSGFFPSTGGTTYTVVGTVQGASDLDLCGANALSPSDHDLFAMNIGSDFLTQDWSCPGIFVAPGEQYLDAAVPLAVAMPLKGDVVIAGRTDGQLNIPATPLPSGPAGVFVARLNAINGNVAWQNVIPMTTTTPVHLDVAADGTLLLSGSFNGEIKDDAGHTISSNGSDNGFVAVIDVATGNPSWIRAVRACDGASGPTSALAAWADGGAIAVAGTVSGSSTLAGGRIDVPGAGTYFYVARLDKHP